ncbi:GMC family oxidoreductase [Pseudomaricurvus alkylphenolicus]|uniref:GMC family oxidoreductase n=1 Tax=Pseudomaricurvus alkylphenolicus TaxID=1306991 RepID=UPI001421ED41|nr:GMC family oxidoreductase [Pseudomaricurvus alkylphenolicus]NIB42179.1 GMC family oxidoreductase [Pseudomaricurvus alkylphenolicus]
MQQLLEEVDVVIVGSGAAGSLMAARLAEAGQAVVILEAGKQRRSSDLVSSQIWARKLKWDGEPVVDEGQHPIGYHFNTGRGTGGSATHHYAVWPRMHPEDFSVASDHGKGLDWPIRYRDLRKHYDLVQKEVGVSGDAETEHWRPEGAAYPLPPVPTFAQGRIIARGFHKLGLRTSPVPLGITSQPYRGRGGCLWDGWCDAGCPIGALANPLAVYLPRALKAGAELRHESCVTRILTDTSGQRATGVDYVTADGKTRTLIAENVILAANPVQNPRLLLASATKHHPQGLANSSGRVGDYLMSHPSVSIYGLFEEQTENFLGATGGQLLCQDGYEKNRHGQQAFGSFQWLIAQAQKPNDLLGYANCRPGLFGSELTAFMQQASSHLATMTSVCEGLPLASNKVRLSTQRFDSNGVPLAQVSHRFADESLALAEKSRQQGERIFEAAGAQEVWSSRVNSMHIMGGTIMGNDSGSSVTNSYGQTHDLPNLFIAGAGLFPTSGGVNPTFTLHALADRAADRIANA